MIVRHLLIIKKGWDHFLLVALLGTKRLLFWFLFFFPGVACDIFGRKKRIGQEDKN